MKAIYVRPECNPEHPFGSVNFMWAEELRIIAFKLDSERIAFLSKYTWATPPRVFENKVHFGAKTRKEAFPVDRWAVLAGQ